MVSREVLVVRLGTGPELALVHGSAAGSAAAAIWPGLGAESRSIVSFALSPEAATVPLEHQSESVYYVTSGTGRVLEGLDRPEGADGGVQHDEDDEEEHRWELQEGSVVHVGAGTTYRFVAGAT